MKSCSRIIMAVAIIIERYRHSRCSDISPSLPSHLQQQGLLFFFRPAIHAMSIHASISLCCNVERYSKQGTELIVFLTDWLQCKCMIGYFLTNILVLFN